jgi:primosomal replication protein N
MSKEIIRKLGEPYISENVHLQYRSSLTNQEAEKLIGKEIQRVESGAKCLILFFTDGSKLIVEGFTLNEERKIDSLDIRLEEKIIKLDI